MYWRSKKQSSANLQTVRSKERGRKLLYAFDGRQPKVGKETFIRDHAIRHVLPGVNYHQTGSIYLSFKVHGLPGNTETAFLFRTDRDILYRLPQSFHEETIQFMAAVMTDILTQQTSADIQFNLFHEILPYHYN